MVYENYWLDKHKCIFPHHERWIKQADVVGLSAEGRRRLTWIIYAEVHKNVSKTCRHFGIALHYFTNGKTDLILQLYYV